MAFDYINGIDFPKEKIDAVCHAILYHSNGSKYAGKQKTIEAKILYDADKLEAVGVMGLIRAFIFLGNCNNPLYVLKDGKIDLSEDCKTDSFVRYYKRHLSKNYDRFFTRTAQELAEKHRAIDEAFFSAFLDSVQHHDIDVNDYLE